MVWLNTFDKAPGTNVDTRSTRHVVGEGALRGRSPRTREGRIGPTAQKGEARVKRSEERELPVPLPQFGLRNGYGFVAARGPRELAANFWMHPHRHRCAAAMCLLPLAVSARGDDSVAKTWPQAAGRHHQDLLSARIRRRTPPGPAGWPAIHSRLSRTGHK